MRLSKELTYEMDCIPIPKTPFISYSHSPHADIFQISLETDKNTDDGRKTPVIDEEFGPPPVFPLAAFYHIREVPHDRLDPRYADRWPIGFDTTREWPTVWAGKTLSLNTFLQEIRLAHRATNVFVTREQHYRGTPWRLRIDEVKATKGKMPILRHGMTISYLHSNTKHLRYIIDHCAYRDKTVAYLKVYCFNLDQDVCDSESTRPPFLLVAPIDYCQVRDYPDSIPTTPSSFISPLYQSQSDFYPPPKSHFSEDGEASQGVIGRICHCLRRLLCH